MNQSLDTQPDDAPNDAAGRARAARPERSPFRAILGGVSLYSLAMIVQRLASILLLPVYTRYLSKTDYGVLELLDLVTNVASLLVGLRLGQSLFYFHHNAADDRERADYATTGFLAAALLGLLAGAFGLAFAPWISRLTFGTPEYTHLVRICFLGFAGALPAEFGYCYLQVTDRAGSYVLASIARLGIAVVGNVVFLAVLGLGVSSMLWSALIATCCVTSFFAWRIFSENPPTFRLPILRSLIRYTVPLGIGTLGDFVLHFGDRILLRWYVPLAALGLYGLSYKLGMIVPYVATPFFAYWNAQMVGLVRRPHGEYVYARVATYYLLFQAAVVLSLTVFIHPLLTILTEASFREAAIYVPWIALAYLIRGMGSFWSNTFILEKRPGLVAQTTWIGSGACLLGYALLIPRFQVWGAIAATLLGFSCMAGYSLYRSQRLRPFSYEYGRWGAIVACAAAASLPSLLARPVHFLAQVGLGLGCLGLFAGLLWAVGFASEGERRAIQKALRRALRRVPEDRAFREEVSVTP